MKSLKNFCGKDLTFEFGTLNFEKEDVLFYGKKVLARLHWKPTYLLSSKGSFRERLKKSHSLLAEGYVKEGKWTFIKSGFLNRKITVRRGSRIVATVAYSHGHESVINFENKRNFILRSARFGTKIIIETDSNKQILTLTAKVFKSIKVGRNIASLKIEDFKELKELPVLVLIVLYITRLMTLDTWAL